VGLAIAVVNQKGGVGKTTTAINLGACLAALGQRVLLVDMDPQGNATSGLGIDKASLTKTVYDCLQGGSPVSSVAVETPVERVWIAPATVDLSGAEVELVSVLARETRLKVALDGAADEYDYILLDSPPSLGLLTVNCLTAADAVLIPIQCEYYALEGLGQLRNTLSLLRRMLNPELEVLGVVLTMYDMRTRLSAEVADEVRKNFAGRVFRSVIPRSVRLSEAPIYGQPIISYAPESRGAEAYTELAREVIEIGETQGDQVADTDGNAGGDGGAGPGASGGEAVSEPVSAADADGRGEPGGTGGVGEDPRDTAAIGGEESGERVSTDSGRAETTGGEAGGTGAGAGAAEGGERPGDAGAGAGGEPSEGGYQPDGGGGGVPAADERVRADAGAGGGAGGEEPAGGGERLEAAEPAGGDPAEPETGGDRRGAWEGTGGASE